MESPSTLHPAKSNSRGFSLFETVIVLAIMGIILAVSIVVSFNSYKGYVFRVERNVLVSMLERARSKAMNNYLGMPHGVCFIAPNYVLFRGTTCASETITNELIPSNGLIHIDGLSPETPIIFEQLTGNVIPSILPATDEKQIKLTSDNQSASVSINNEGRINW